MHRPTRPTVEIKAAGAVDASALQALRKPLAKRFRANIIMGEPIELRPEWFASLRRQYRADRILDALVACASSNAHWTLGVADQDLYAPRLRFVFGQATVSGCCALIGLARLRPEFHGQLRDDDLFHRRVLTEAVHELGHVAGREHCPDPRCVMYFSNTLDDTDLKGADFCVRCVAPISSEPELEDAGFDRARLDDAGHEDADEADLEGRGLDGAGLAATLEDLGRASPGLNGAGLDEIDTRMDDMP